MTKPLTQSEKAKTCVGRLFDYEEAVNLFGEVADHIEMIILNVHQSALIAMRPYINLIGEYAAYDVGFAEDVMGHYYPAILYYNGAGQPAKVDGLPCGTYWGVMGLEEAVRAFETWLGSLGIRLAPFPTVEAWGSDTPPIASIESLPSDHAAQMRSQRRGLAFLNALELELSWYPMPYRISPGLILIPDTYIQIVVYDEGSQPLLTYRGRIDTGQLSLVSVKEITLQACHNNPMMTADLLRRVECAQLVTRAWRFVVNTMDVE